MIYGRLTLVSAQLLYQDHCSYLVLSGAYSVMLQVILVIDLFFFYTVIVRLLVNPALIFRIKVLFCLPKSSVSILSLLAFSLSDDTIEPALYLLNRMVLVSLPLPPFNASWLTWIVSGSCYSMRSSSCLVLFLEYHC